MRKRSGRGKGWVKVGGWGWNKGDIPRRMRKLEMEAALLEMSVFIKHLRTFGGLRRNIQNVEKS